MPVVHTRSAFGRPQSEIAATLSRNFLTHGTRPSGGYGELLVKFIDKSK